MLSKRTIVAFFIVAIVAVNFNQPASGQQTTSPTPSQPLKLAVILAPPLIPADGGLYDSIVVQIQDKAGLPVPAREDISVTVTSSKLEVGRASSPMIISKGKTFSKGFIQTSTTPASTNITAVASGFEAGRAVLSTVSPAGSPLRLSVTAGPRTLLPKSNAVITVQLLDANSRPAAAQDDLQVTLASSFLQVGSVDPFLIVKKGSTFGRAQITSTLAIGETTITASASGFITGSAAVTTTGAAASRLAVYASPTRIPEKSNFASIVAVQLQDNNGLPARAPSEVQVALTSSDQDKATLPDPIITIKTGETYALGRVLALVAGDITLSASAQGYTNASTVITVYPRIIGSKGSLSVTLNPPRFLPDNSTHQTVIVHLRDTLGNPIVATTDLTVFLSSSNTAVASVEPRVTLTKGQTYATATLRTTFATGTTSIIASASNFRSDIAEMQVVGSVPSRLGLTSIPPFLPADGKDLEAAIIELLDNSGRPARAPQDITVSLASSRTDIAKIEETVTIKSGATYNIAKIFTSLAAGKTNITASAVGYATSRPATVETTLPTPSRLVAYVLPQIIPAVQEPTDNIVIQLQDPNGVPARARSPITIFVSSSSPQLEIRTPSLTLQAASTYVRSQLLPKGTEVNASITVLAPGYIGSTVQARTILLNSNMNVAARLPTKGELTYTATAHSDFRIEVSATSYNQPLEGASVGWSANLKHKLASQESVTNSTGSSYATLRFEEAGNATLTVTLTKPGYSTQTRTARITVTPARMDLTLKSDKHALETGEATGLIFQATFQNKALPNVTLTWSTSLGNIGSRSSATDKDGLGKAAFFSNINGTAKVTVVANAPGLASANQTLTIDITLPKIQPPIQPPVVDKQTNILGLGANESGILVIVEAGAIIALIVYQFVLRKLRLRRAGSAAEEDEYVR